MGSHDGTLLFVVVIGALLVDVAPLLRRHPSSRDERAFCSRRPGSTCCPGRDDQCTVPIEDTLCYCDIFCNRTDGADCCPDFWSVCFGVTPETFLYRTTSPRPGTGSFCQYHGRHYAVGESYRYNCNNCTCQRSSWKDSLEFLCSEKPCMIREEVIDHVNRGHFGWRSSNYSFFWGLSLADGVRHRLGTLRPSSTVQMMSPIRGHAGDNEPPPPKSFDWRRKSPDSISPIVDQGNCAASWALSSASVASDRLAIQSGLGSGVLLSSQQILSCNRDADQDGCRGGHVDRAWWYIWKVGLVEESCYPLRSNFTSHTGHCKLNRVSIRRSGTGVRCPPGATVSTSAVHSTSPAYRIPPQEKQIMKEIMESGPVQTIFEVKDDFFMYKGGVYRYSMPASYLAPNHLPTGLHSVKIVGWGEEEVDGHRLKFWTCANSWGRDWGEGGYFRIVRGTNECDIESFIVGVWAKIKRRNKRSTDVNSATEK